MSIQDRFNIIIAGAGAAGLSLLWRIMNSDKLRDQHVLLIDKSFEPTGHKTWCFWENTELPDADLLYHSWNKLLVKLHGETFSEKLNQYQYHCLRSHDFANAVLETARRNQQVTLIEATIDDFSGNNARGTVHTSHGEFTADYIFQSVKSPPDFDVSKVDVSLTQHFLGWEIESDSDPFDPETPVFMDFDVPQKDGVSFMYLLPFSEKRALVEYTVFSKKVMNKNEYERELSYYLESRYQLTVYDYSINRKEMGAIPMEDRKYSSWYCNRVMNIGTVGGLSKPSTGYTFSRIQAHSVEIVKALEKKRDLPEGWFSSYRFRVYDLMMLYLLEHEPGHSIEIFYNLFKKNRFDLILRFLAEQTDPGEELSIFSKMPYMPFFRSIYKMKHRIFTGG